jgi:addiction module RelE/StbE family toxin
MGFKVLITDTALKDLQEIVEFVAQDDSRAAKRLGEKLIVPAMSLANLPERHAFYDQRRGVRKMPLNPYLIFYNCDREARVVNILHF